MRPNSVRPPRGRRTRHREGVSLQRIGIALCGSTARLALAAFLLAPLAHLARGQVPAGLPAENTSDNLIIKADRATTWLDPQNRGTNIVQLEGNVTIELDRTRMTADRAVVWLAPTKGSLLEEHDAQVALIGNATLDQQNQVQRSGDRLFVTATVRGVVRVTADKRDVGNQENSELYQAAKSLRPLSNTASGAEIDDWLTRPT